MKTVLITGANRGIGLSFVKKYLKEGWSVIATARNPDKAKELNELQDAQLQIEKLDISDGNSVSLLKQRLGSRSIHLLINNSGIYLDDSLKSLDASSILEQFKVNSIGPLLVTQTLMSNLNLSEEATKVVNISSRYGSIEEASTGSYGYRASKAALNMFTKLLSNQMKKENMKICVVSLHPGYVKTDMTSGGGDITPEDSVENLFKVIDSLKMPDTGSFYARDGNAIPW